ncbi:recombinase [Bradyrhizobium oligotrophicum S58]|uniref:Recombinase n=1 Tax=Bradyrhizobium oligotrophicum S58 TaxID=1245469 RepID=M4ZL52_9BRAD|nr:recombinase family protein [Bradyrhizobium oligotrophicum]BAM86975.1 recombinase [Bradyrhizobium oligotrophicum S58]
MASGKHAVAPADCRAAAQYLRVSTESQKYSIENQAAAIAAYAARRGIEIVETYADRGRSGVSVAGRDALKRLIAEVELGRSDYQCILVYDVSRWGRFQDVDESAYYEFICKRAGIKIQYCADEFENDGSMASAVLKNIKRLAAADYSRQLSKKVFLGHSRIASQGYWRGGPAPYGLRRQLVDERGRSKGILQSGDRKSLKTDRTLLVPGPKREIRIVERVFELFVNGNRSRTEIAADLNAKGVRNARGRRWSMLTINNVLNNEAYLGHIVFNRRSAKLGERAVHNPPEMWIRHKDALAPIIRPHLFERAKKKLRELECGRTRTDKELLDILKDLLRREGRLTMKCIIMAKGVPNCSVYARRFGSLDEAYRRIGYRPHVRYRFKEVQAHIQNIIHTLAEQISADLEGRGRRVAFMPELCLLTLNGDVTVSLAVARAVKDGSNGARAARRWELRKMHFTRSNFTIVARMDARNTAVVDYFLLPTANLPVSKKDHRTRISERFFGEFRCADLQELMVRLVSRIPKVADHRVSAGRRRSSGSPA